MKERSETDAGTKDPARVDDADNESDQVFSSAAELFRLLATPIRLKIISALCNTEKNVSQLLAEIDTTQPNMSQHLSTLYRAGVLSRRRDATQIYYRIGNERAASLCRAVCTQIALEADGDDEQPSSERLTPQLGVRY
jgi:ArsR family transcriptional regulator